MYLSSYRGDPGFFGTLGKIVGGAAKLGGGLLPGPAGGLLRTVGTVLTRSTPRPTPMAQMPRALPQPPSRFTGLAARGPGGFGVQVGRYERTGYEARGTLPAFGSPDGDCPKGYRLNKTGYFLKSGQYVAPRSKCVKIRYRDVGNTKALRKAVSRASGFDKLVKRNRKALRALARI